MKEISSKVKEKFEGSLLKGGKCMEKKKTLKGFCSKLKKVFLPLIFLSLFLLPVNQAKASKEEMYILLNLLVEKGVITPEESKEMMAAVDNIVKKQKEDSAKNSVKTSAAENIKIGGYLQSRYDVYDYKGKNDEFTIKRARISLTGKIMDPVSFKIEFDTVKGKNNDLLTDAWVKLAYFPQFNITVGQFKLPFSEEYLISSSALDTIERSNVVGALATEYDRGIMIDGDLLNKAVYYGLAYVNGTGANTGEDNDSKDLVGRIAFSPWVSTQNPASGLKFGFAYQTGEQNIGANKKDRVRHDIFLRYEYKNLKVLGEYINQELKSTSTTKSDGYFVQCAYEFPLSNGKSIQPVVKYEVYDPNTKASKDTQTIFTTGFNFFLNKNTKLSTNYRWRNDEQGGKIATNSNEWFSQIQIKF